MTIMLFGCSGAILNNRNGLTFAPFSPCLPSVPAGPAGPLRGEKQLKTKPSTANIYTELPRIKKVLHPNVPRQLGSVLSFFLFHAHDIEAPFLEAAVHQYLTKTKTCSGNHL